MSDIRVSQNLVQVEHTNPDKLFVSQNLVQVEHANPGKLFVSQLIVQVEHAIPKQNLSTFPTIKILTGLSVKNIKPANRKTSAAGYSMSRAKATVAKKEFILKYKYVSDADKITVDNFFNTNKKNFFNLNAPDPADSTIYTVIFGQDSIDWTYSNQGAGSWSTSIVFQEI